jgi:leucyl aminopeptidase
MAQKTSKKTSTDLWGFELESLLLKQLQPHAKSGANVARVIVQAGKKAAAVSRTAQTDQGLEIQLAPLAATEAERDPRLKTSPFVRMRDAVGATIGVLEKAEITWVEFDLQLDNELLEAAILGLELGLYRFKRVFKSEKARLGIHLKNKGKAVPSSSLEAGTTAGLAVNLARHLTNLPPNVLNPVSYATRISAAFASLPHVKVEVWEEERLAKENMNLLRAVGNGSVTPARLVHFAYRPPGVKKTPVALVGKGITFDSGGLDIKPAAGMRLMKKDMGGSAAVAGVLLWAARFKLKCALDVYMPLAENSIGGRAFRPSDVLSSRNGLSVEIHNTDAEGRLVLADAMDVAVTAKDRPRCVIDVATLTGAIKVALGSGMAGLFANDGRLAQALAAAGQKSGDLVWIMPLYQKYRAQMASTFADMINSPDGYGGAVTAALFLEKFARDVPWAHLDIYAWKDSGDGAWLEAGGSGQSVLGLAQWLRELK